ncbi:MAG: hypothetical protein SGBAC_011580, partial [Bacillariaceae sp.]
ALKPFAHETSEVDILHEIPTIRDLSEANKHIDSTIATPGHSTTAKTETSADLKVEDPKPSAAVEINIEPHTEKSEAKPVAIPSTREVKPTAEATTQQIPVETKTKEPLPYPPQHLTDILKQTTGTKYQHAKKSSKHDYLKMKNRNKNYVPGYYPITNSNGGKPVTYPPAVYVDPYPPHYRALLGEFLVQDYPLHTGHDMDAVVLASHPDATLAASIHNLYHLQGFRRFIFVVDNSTRTCPEIFDLLPQHGGEPVKRTIRFGNGFGKGDGEGSDDSDSDEDSDSDDEDTIQKQEQADMRKNKPFLEMPTTYDPRKKHVCLSHTDFYTPEQVELLMDQNGRYGNIHEGPPSKVNRGGKMYANPRMGWYLQQFTKLLIPRLIPDLSPQYFTIDGDIIPNRPFDYRKFNYRSEELTFVMPQVYNDQFHCRKFVDDVFPELVGTRYHPKATNVVGWMVIDREISDAMIENLDRNMTNVFGYEDTFPFNVLQYANELIKEDMYFSEYFTYGLFALDYDKRNEDYNHKIVIQEFEMPARNQNINKSCLMNRKHYVQVQRHITLPPWIIWEMHKYTRFNSCPDDNYYFQFSTVGIWHDFHKPPWGGGNQFLLALRHGMDEAGVQVIGKNDPENGQQRLLNESQIMLANAITFKGDTTPLDNLKALNNLGLVHRVDGPYYVARYFKALNFTDKQGPGPLDKEDNATRKINRRYACSTIFQSHWSMEANIKIGLDLRNPVVIPNMIDEAIFYPPKEARASLAGRKIRIVATSHSDNQRKGFDTMLWMDENLDFDRYEMMFMGGYPKWFTPKRLQIVTANGSAAVADFLRSGDIYFAPSRFEPASNAVSEALACGLPVMYQEGSSHGDLVGEAGLGFKFTGPALLKSLDDMVENYSTHFAAIFVPGMKEITDKYLSIMRWCFYMKRLIL